MASGAEPAHVEKYQDDESEGSRRGGKAGCPVGDAELLEETHGSPVVEGGFFEPWLAVEDGCNGAAGYAVEGGADILRAETAGDHLGVDGVAGVGVSGEHFAGDLGVTWLVGTHQAELIAAEGGDEAVEQQEGGYSEKDDELADGSACGQSLAEPPAECVVAPFADGGGLLLVGHQFMRSQTRLSESRPELG